MNPAKLKARWDREHSVWHGELEGVKRSFEAPTLLELLEAAEHRLRSQGIHRSVRLVWDAEAREESRG